MNIYFSERFHKMQISNRYPHPGDWWWAQMGSLQSKVFIPIFFRKFFNIILKFIYLPMLSTAGFLISQFSSSTCTVDDLKKIRPTHFDIKLKLSLEELLLPVLLTSPPETMKIEKHCLTFWDHDVYGIGRVYCASNRSRGKCKRVRYLTWDEVTVR
jgi:hypothetical protein